MDLKTILVPLAGSGLAELALKPAVKLVREKDAKLVLVRAAEAHTIVMSSHGRSGLGRLVLGSVAESVLRATRTPILPIRSGNAPIEAPYWSRSMARRRRRPSSASCSRSPDRST